MKVGRKFLFVFLLGLLFGACECDERLNEICPPPEDLGRCIIDDGTGDWEEAETADFKTGGASACNLGQIVCDPTTLELTCEGYVGPIEEQVCNRIDDDCDGEIDEPQYDPSIEVCNGLDDNCDGLIDNMDPVPCWTGRHGALFSDESEGSICEKGLKYCEGGQFSECRDQVLNEPEMCDGLDNDCDGTVDADSQTEGRSCGPATSVGQCAFGSETCLGGESVCIGDVHPSTESCDNVDNDCDGTIDNDLFRPCVTACGSGLETCSQGNWVSCSAPLPQDEICDGFDNDCDGEIDEGCPCVSGTAQLCVNDIVDGDGNEVNCGVGTQVCEEGVWSPCIFFSAMPEECNNHDDDCDGVIDDFTVACGDPEAGSTGLCELGTQLCAEGEWQECEGAVLPEEEKCDGEDNDCDGLVDEDLDPDEKVDMCFVIDISGSMCTYIDALEAGMASYIADLQGTEHRFCLITYPGANNDLEPTVVTVPPLVDAATFANTLASLACNGGGIEPTYDVLEQVTEATDPLLIQWRDDATPYVVVITDENAQTSNGTSKSDIAQNVTNCQLGNCEAGDRVETFVITKSSYFHEYDTITFNDPDRLFEIDPAGEERYSEIFHEILTNVCIYNDGDSDAGN